MPKYIIHLVFILLTIVGITNMRQSGKIDDLSDRVKILEQAQ